VGNVVEDFFERFAAVLFWVFQLAREFGRALALEDHPHVRRRQVPLGMAGRHVCADKVFVLVTVLAFHCVKAFAVESALDVLEMQVAVLALQWNVAVGMAIHAARVHEDRISGEEGGA
jgi:hypothetical protein